MRAAAMQDGPKKASHAADNGNGPLFVGETPQDVPGPRVEYQPTKKMYEKPTDKPDYSRLSSAGSTSSEPSLPGTTIDEILLQDSLAMRAAIARPSSFRSYAWTAPPQKQPHNGDQDGGTPRAIYDPQRGKTMLEPFLQGDATVDNGMELKNMLVCVCVCVCARDIYVVIVCSFTWLREREGLTCSCVCVCVCVCDT
jgi:hypothetical protein